MANGTAALALLPPAPEPTHASPSTGDQEGIKIALGQAMADATDALGAALADLDAGGRLSDANRTRGGETIAALVELQLAHFGAFDFGAVALAAGRRAIFARHGVMLRQHCGAVPETALDGLLTHILAVASKVAAIGAVYRSN
jgi:hypothetical protein